MEKDATFRRKAYAHLKQLADESPAYDDAKMLVAAADTVASLKNNTVRRTIDTEWIEKIEYAIPYLDAFIRSPGIAIQENEEVLPVELTKKVSEKSIRYLAQHTNHILKIEDDDVTPSKLLNIFRDETLLTYENKFINTLLIRLIAFIDKRHAVLEGTCGIEKNYVFDYHTSFHHSLLESEKNTAKLSLKIELTSPMKDNLTDEEIAGNEEYAQILQRLYRIRSSIMAFTSSPLIVALGKNYIRPPVIRTNPILKNKNLNACLTLWEYIESVDKAGFSMVTDEFREMPSDEYISELYSSVALQYLQFYSGVAGDDADNRLLSERRLNETFPDFDSELDLEEVDDFTVYDTDYKKLVPISNFLKYRRKLSEDERKMRVAIEVALRADRIIFDEYMAEQERIRLAEEARLAKLLALEEKKKNIQYRYSRTFLARLIQANDEIKGYYGAIKNTFFSYKKVKSRISKKCETFNFGRTKLAKLDVRGKRIDLYLALDPNEFIDLQKFYNFKDVSDKKKDFPMLMRVNGPIKLKRAIELINILLEKVGAQPIPNYVEQDFYLPYETTAALVKKGLIKDLRPDLPSEEEEVAEDKLVTMDEAGVKYRYSRTYLARLIQSSDQIKGYYGEVKNKFLAYKKVRTSISKRCETVYLGRMKLAKINVIGKKLDLYLALDPNEFIDQAKFYNFKDVSDKKKDCPMLMRVSGPIKLKRALELIQILLEKVGAQPIDGYVDQNFYMPYETTAALIKKGLIKDLRPDLPTEEEEVAEDTNENAEEDVVEIDGEMGVKYRYSRTYLARLIQSSDQIKAYYGEVKNKFLAYKKVRTSISKRCETVYLGRMKLAKINVIGKKLDLYLALDPNEFIDQAKFYNFKDVSDKKKDCPMLMRVSGPIKLKRALELIQILLEKVGAQPIDGYVDQDFYMPYETTAALIEKGLIKELIKGLPMNEEPTQTVEESPMEAGKNPAEEVDENAEEDFVEIDGEMGVKYRYSRTCLARFIQSSDQIKAYYGAIKNKFLAYKKVKARISKRCETVYLGRMKLAKLNVIGKKVDLYLALDPNEFIDQAKFYNFKDVSDKRKDFPMLMRVSGPIKLKRALELIQILLEKVGVKPIDGYVDQDFYLPYETTEALIEKGLIKELVKTFLIKTEAVAQTPTDELEEVAATIAPIVEDTDEVDEVEETITPTVEDTDKVEEVEETITPIVEDTDKVEEVEETITPTVEDTDKVEEVEETITPIVEDTDEVDEVEETITPIVEEVEEVEEAIATTVEDTDGLDEEADDEEENDELLTRGRENVGVVFGTTCVFKPYYDGYESDDVLEIPVSKQRFESLKEKRQIRIFKRAEKKREKKVKKQ